MPLVMGVDSSTQATKVEVRDADSGALVASGRAPHPVAQPPCSEQEPEAWWDGLAQAVAAAGVPEVAAISVAGQQHGMVLLDHRGRVLRPAKLWNDTESAPEAARMVAELGAEAWAEVTGSVPVAALTITKLAWMADHEPAVLDEVAKVVLPHDYLTHRLTGRFVTDRGDASGTGYFDPVAGGWRTDLLDRFVAPGPWAERLPEVLDATTAAGEVVEQAARQLGIPTGVVVGPGTGDNMAAALGAGLRLGEVGLSLGTSGTVYATSERPTFDATGTVAGFADATGRFLPLVCTLNATKVTDVFARLLGVGARRARRAGPGRAARGRGRGGGAVPRRRADPEPPGRDRRGARAPLRRPPGGPGPGRLRGRGVRAPRRAGRAARRGRRGAGSHRARRRRGPVCRPTGASSPTCRVSPCSCRTTPSRPPQGRACRPRPCSTGVRSRRCGTRGTSGPGRSPSPRRTGWGRSCERPTASPWDRFSGRMVDAYRDASLGVEDRVHDLLGRMDIDEKVAQLGCLWVTSLVGDDGIDHDAAASRLRHGIGQITRIGASTGLRPAGSAALMNEIQRIVVERTRLGIPLLVHEESVAGYLARDATVFPQALGLACSWDPALLTEVGGVIREQMVAVGARLTPRAGARRRPRSPVGAGRGDLRRGSRPVRHARHGLRARRSRATTSARVSPRPASTSSGTRCPRAAGTTGRSTSVPASCARSTRNRSPPRSATPASPRS